MLNSLNNSGWRYRVLLPGMMVILGGCASVPENEEPVAKPQERVSTYPYDDGSRDKGYSVEVKQIVDAESDADGEVDSQAKTNVTDETKQGTVDVRITKIEREPAPEFEQKESESKVVSKPDPETATGTRYGTVSCIIKFDGQRYDDKLSAGFLSNMRAAEPESASFFISKVFASAARDIPAFINDDFPTVAGVGEVGDIGSHRHDFKDHLPGYNNAVMRMRVGEHFLAINPVSILQNRRVAAPNSTGRVYQKANGKWVAQATLNGMSISYPAAHDKSLALFRWKANEDAVRRAGILGVDVLVRQFTKKDFGKLHDFPGRVYYLERGEIYTWKTSFSIKLSNNINPQWRFF